MPVSPSPGQVYMVNGLIISQSPTPPADDADRMAAVYNHVKQSYDQAQKTFQRVLKRELKQADLPLPEGTRFNIFAAQNVAENAEVVIANQVYEALKRLQAANITPDQKVGKNSFVSEEKAGANFQQISKDAKIFLSGLKDLIKVMEKGNPREDLKNFGAWRNVRGRFFRLSGQLRSYSDRIMKDKWTDKDAKEFINFLRAQFGNNFGLVMEDLIRELMNTPEVQQRFAEEVGEQIVKAWKPTNTHGAPGTIRASVKGISYTKDKNGDITLAESGKTGNPLQDGVVRIKKMDAEGFIINVDTGISAKTINFASDFYKKFGNQVNIAELSIGNFADVFSNFYVSNRVGKTNTGVQGMYLYRTLTKYGDQNNPVALYIAQRKLNDILFSGLNDVTGIVVINGIMMNAAEYYAEGKIGISTSGLPKKNGEWIKPEDALDYIATIHSAKLKAVIRLNGTFVQSL